VSFSWGYADGQLRSSTDQNTQTTSFQYNDLLGRLTQITFPDGGKTNVVYDDTLLSQSMTTCQLISGAAGATCSAASPPTGWKTNLTLFDGMGHVATTKLASDPDGATYTATYTGSQTDLTARPPIPECRGRRRSA